MDADDTTAESMTDAMSYQYPPPPPHGVEMGMSSSAYAATYAPLPHSSEFGMGSEHDPNYSPRDRRDSFSTAMHLKRSMSTPNVRPELPLEQAHMQHQGQPVDHVSFLAADKRRNKLGYHRTSVACGHCRRRKIRCLPSSDDPEGRRINCIRLKKDCNFFPAGLPPAPAPADSRQKSGSRCSVGPGGVPPASSSPSIASGILRICTEDSITRIRWRHQRNAPGVMVSTPTPKQSQAHPQPELSSMGILP